MSKKIISLTTILIGACVVLFSGCYKVTTLVIPNNEEVTRTVSFTADILPITAQSCSISGCHNSGSIKPDLSTDKIYNNLINGSYINLGTPENSELYLWLTGKKAATMPVNAANNPLNLNNLILAWIKQGAKNN